MAKQEVEVTFRELFTYTATANRIKPKPDTDPKTKLEYAIDRNRAEVDRGLMEYNTRLQDIRREHAATEKNGNDDYLKNKDGDLVFSKDADKKVNDVAEKLKDEKIKLMVYHATAVSKNISPYTIETLQPISISPDYELPEDTDLPEDVPNLEPQKASRA